MNHGRGHYVRDLVAKFPSRVRTADEAERAVDVYRSVLSQAKDHSVVIVLIGHMTNLLGLLQSTADRWSSMSGPEMITLKVRQMVLSASPHHEPRHSQDILETMLREQLNSGASLSGWQTLVSQR